MENNKLIAKSASPWKATDHPQHKKAKVGCKFLLKDQTGCRLGFHGGTNLVLALVNTDLAVLGAQSWAVAPKEDLVVPVVTVIMDPHHTHHMVVQAEMCTFLNFQAKIAVT